MAHANRTFDPATETARGRARLPSLLAALLLGPLLALAALPARAWWNDDWSTRTRVTVDAGAAGVRLAAPLTGAALALRLHSGNFDFARARDDGSDLRVVAGDDRTPLAFAIERYDALDELALLWVELPRVEAGGAPLQLYVYAGNPKAAAGPGAAAAGAATGGATVFRLEQPDGRDAAGRLRASAPFVPETHALLAGGARLAGLPVVWPANEALAAPAEQPLTWSLWVKPDANAGGTLLQQGALVLALREGRLVAQAGEQALAAAAPPAGRWSHVALVFGGAATAAGRAELRVDGERVAEGPLARPALAGELAAGRDFSGAIDQIELAAAARGEDWARFAVASQGTEGRLVTTAKEDREGADAEEGGGHGYLGILLANLTTDAWVVIVVLALMFATALWVMATKAVLVVRTDRANRSFLARFRAAAGDLLAVDGVGAPAGGAAAPAPDPALRDSSLRRLYAAGVRELRKRGVGVPDAPGLSGASLDAVKAAVDADMVREMHLLNARIVLLTIAISGGPFLGLLGTVVGVMITFAAIAAAGDVNVNAIAPGIAAALLATVAGLAVAIPSLFGYNYLASRIKNISADMQIFADEFIARVAEIYGQR